MAGVRAVHTFDRHGSWLFASVLGAALYYVVARQPWPDGVLIALKGSGVALLALWAWQAGPDGRERKMLAAILALGAVADMVLELSLEAGAAIFLAGHLVAIWLYRSQRRPDPAASQKAAAAALLLIPPLLGWWLTRDPLVALYATGLGAMAGAAWLSRYSRYRVGIGAVLFVVSDLLIFARAAGQATALADWLVWPLYYGGQFLIATGVIAAARQASAGGGSSRSG